MKKKVKYLYAAMLVLLFTLLPLQNTAAEERNEWSFNIIFTWDLGLRLGVDYRPWDNAGISANIGSSLFSLEDDGFLITGDLLFMYHFSDPDQRLQLSTGVGIPDWRLVFTDPFAGEVALGVSGRAGYQFEAWMPFIRAGAGVPLLREGSEFSIADTSLPLGLWPDLSLGAQIQLP